jgi:hypothetical protein
VLPHPINLAFETNDDLTYDIFFKGNLGIKYFQENVFPIFENLAWRKILVTLKMFSVD